VVAKGAWVTEPSRGLRDKDWVMLDKQEYADQVQDLRRHLLNAVAAATIGVPERLRLKSEFARMGGSLAQNEMLQVVAMHMTSAADAFDRIQLELGIYPAQRTWFGAFLDAVQYRELMEKYRSDPQQAEVKEESAATETAEPAATSAKTRARKTRKNRGVKAPIEQAAAGS
jgi:hypothetical protein